MEYRFDPPLTVQGKTIVFTLDDAAAFVRSFQAGRRPVMRDGLLRRLEAAHTEWEQKEAADAFRGWAEAEGVLVKVGV
jgi:hypothetical protein